MSSYYRVELSVGLNPNTSQPYSWTVRQGDPADYGPTDDLIIEWHVPDNEPYPWQFDPAEAQFGIVVAQASDLDIDIGDTVSIAVFTGDVPVSGYPYTTPPPLALFAGRIADLEAVPHDLGIVYRIKCVDYLADLIAKQIKDIGSGPEVPTQQNPIFWNHLQSNIRQYMDDLAEAAGIPSPFWSSSNPDPNEQTWGLNSLGLGMDSAFTHMTRVLLSYINLSSIYYGSSGARGVLAPQANWDQTTWDAELDDTRPFAVEWIEKELTTAYPWSILPGELVETSPGVWGIVVDPDATDRPDAITDSWPHPIPNSEMGIIPASTVELDSVKWTRSKSQAVDTIELGWRSPQGPGGTAGGLEHTYRFGNVEKPIPIVRSLGQLHMWNGSWAGATGQVPIVARYYVPEVGAGLNYQADRFLIRPTLGGNDPLNMSRLGFRNLTMPLSATQNPLVVISGVPEHWNPNPGAWDWYAGIVRGCRFRILNADYTFELELDQLVPRSNYSELSDSSFLRWSDVGAASSGMAAITWQQLDARMTWQDLRIVRRPPGN